VGLERILSDMSCSDRLPSTDYQTVRLDLQSRRLLQSWLPLELIKYENDGLLKLIEGLSSDRVFTIDYDDFF
jgi:hypothetical protein